MVLLLKNLLFSFIVPGTVAVYVPLWLAGELAGGNLLAVPLFALGGAIYVWCVWDFATFGRATPAPIDAPVKLVVRGLYRVSRNPMYVGVLVVIVAWAVWFGAPAIAAYAAGVWLCFQGFIVLYEEPHLRKVFGEEYDAYRVRVGRWLPRLTAAQPPGNG